MAIPFTGTVTADDRGFMTEALRQARQAQQMGEVPVGAVVVKDGVVLATGRNAAITRRDPTAHAEIAALREAAHLLGNYRLDGCDLYVTLEPCPMCAGAILHSRIRRVVYGADEPKTGAVRSVLHLFDDRRLNHQTVVEGGLLADECGALLRDFFQERRAQQTAFALREDALRTPETCFADLVDFPWSAHWVNDLPSLQGLRMHYLDEGPKDAGVTFVCLHGRVTWSYLFRRFIDQCVAAGRRVVAPDLIGFGKSDKPKKEAFHDPQWHRRVLNELLESLSIERAVLVLPYGDDVLGLALELGPPLERTATLQWMKVARLDERTPEEVAAYRAPFPDRGHQAALRAFSARPASSGTASTHG